MVYVSSLKESWFTHKDQFTLFTAGTVQTVITAVNLLLALKKLQI